MRGNRADATALHASGGRFPAVPLSLARQDLERLVPAKLSEILLSLVERHPELLAEVAEDVAIARKTSPEAALPDETLMVGTCGAMRGVFEQIRRYGQVDAPVLIRGESGTGKELAAKAIHERSQYSNGPFIAVNCGGLPETLVASELFGYERGAFTGATERRIGRIEAAAGGTLFLDEIGDMPLALQPQLLRFLQEMAICRVGGREVVPVDVRVIAATNVDLESAIDQAQFRKDLYFRLNVLRLDLPPLREREGDIEVLARYLIRKIVEEHGIGAPDLTESAVDCLRRHDWPGNIREMTSTLRRAIVMSNGGSLDEADFEFDETCRSARESVKCGVRVRSRSKKPPEAELRRVLDDFKNNITRTAAYFGVSRVTIYNWLKQPQQ